MERITQLIETIPWPTQRDSRPIVSVAAATALLLSSYYLMTRRRDRHGKYTKEIPTPGDSVPFFGHLLALGDVPSLAVNKWHKEHGPIIKIKMGVKTWVFVDDPLLAHKIFVNHGAESSYRPYTEYGHHHYSFGGKGLAFAQPGPGFRRCRSAALSLLAPKNISNFAGNIEEESSQLTERLIAATEKHGSVIPVKDLQLASMNIIFDATFGRRFKSVEDPEFYFLAEIAERSLKNHGPENDMSSFLPILKIVDLFTGRQNKWKKFINEDRDPAFRRLIAEALLQEKPNLINSITSNGFEMDEEEIIVFATDIVVAGTDTFAVTMSWSFLIMCHHPDVQDRVCAEVKAFEAKHGRLPTFEDRLEVPFSISVQKESMRYRPPTFFGVPHAVREDLEVDGYVIPKDADVLPSMHSMHLNADRYEQADKFMPERFMDNLKTMQSSANGRIEERDHYNFGWGRRICPGAYLAEVEVFNAFVKIYSQCKIVPADGEPMPDLDTMMNGGLVTLPKPQKLKFIRRV
ncbi:cytochrome P450 [Choanephora cucurbitarum]|nr:cytochrome P450 [Choanephora cucurbitarum]